jgi:hypothetical protein
MSSIVAHHRKPEGMKEDGHQSLLVRSVVGATEQGCATAGAMVAGADGGSINRTRSNG